MRQEITGRVYVGPQPERGPHPGYRGPLEIDTLGVHIGETCEELVIAHAPEDWPDSSWHLIVSGPLLLPWHRVDIIEITNQQGATT